MNIAVQADRTEVTAWPIAPGALLLVGRIWQPMPAAGVAQLERRRSDRGPFRSLSWSLEDGEGASAFVAAVRLPATAQPAGGQTVFLEDGRSGSVGLRLPAALGSGADCAAEAVHLVHGNRSVAAALARFMMSTFPASAMARLPAIGAMLAALLAGLAVDDGCVELMGAIPGACGFLQGWGGPVEPEPGAGDGGVDALLVGERIVRARMRMATFARPDIVTPASGVVLVVDDQSATDASAANIQAALAALPGLDVVYLVSEGAVLRRALVARRLLSPSESVGHIRDMLPSLRCAPAAADCLRLALRPRYEGRDTLGEQALPVRAAVDQALLLPPEAGQPAGFYLGGWLFDPTRVVSEITLRDAGGFAARIDQAWTRIGRPDVTTALTADGFPAPANDAHGFAVYVEGPGSPGSGLHLDIGFFDGTCAFVPVAARPAYDAAARAQVLGGTDLHKPSGISVVERQLGPLFLAMLRRTATRAPAPAAPAPGLNVAPALNIAIVVALSGKPALPRIVLSQFLHDPLASDEALVLVCGDRWDDGALATLRRTVAFMGLAAQIITAPEATDAAAALDVAAERVVAQRYLLLDPATAGCRPGWRRRLRAAAEATEAPTVVCPTLVYEDLSIRYAGAEGMTIQPAAPYIAVSRGLAGMPVALADDGLPRPTVLGTLACALVPRAALGALGAARTRLASAFGQETAFFLRLRAAGVACLWVPRAQVYAPEALAEADPPGVAVGRLVDGWCLRAAHQAGLFAARPTNLPIRTED